jgi:hypothetical protein
MAEHSAFGGCVGGSYRLDRVSWLGVWTGLAKKRLAGDDRMKLNTAFCFVLAGAALAFRGRRMLRFICVFIIAVVIALSLIEYYIPGESSLICHRPNSQKIKKMKLVDFEVMVIEGTEGTGARVRVRIDSGDAQEVWSTVGVSENIIEAAWQALVDSVQYKLLKKQDSGLIIINSPALLVKNESDKIYRMNRIFFPFQKKGKKIITLRVR